MTAPATPPTPQQNDQAPPSNAPNPTMPATTATTTPPASWTQAASSAAAGAPSTGPQQPSQPRQQPLSANASATPVPAPPATAQPVRAKGIRGAIDMIVDKLAGTDTSRVRKDADGTLYLQHETPTRGQQWLRIASDAFRGAAAGMAAGKGAGNQGKALQAGIQAGDEQTQHQQDQYKEQQLAVANSQTLKHQMAANAFAMTRLQVKAAQDDIDFSQKRADWLHQQGGTPVGHVTQLTDLTKLMRDTPGFHEDQVQNDLMIPVQQYDEDGKANGFEIYRMPQGYGEETTPPGTVFHVFNPLLNSGKGGLEEQKTTAWTPKSKINSYEMAAGTQAQEFALKAADVAAKQAEPGKTNAEAAEARASAAVKPSEAAKNYAEAHKDEAEATAAAAADPNSPAAQDLVDQIGAGKMPVGRMAYLMAKKPELLAAVAKKYPGFDESKIDAYAKTYQDFTSGKAGTAVNAGGTAFQHLLKLQQLNTVASHIPGTGPYRAYQTQLHTLSDELGKFYGASTVHGQEGFSEDLGSLIPGTRDRAIKTQAEAMGVKMDQYEQQWRNAAPSAAYEAPLPGIGLEAKEARASLDPSYGAKATVRMKAPNGEISTVPLNQAKHYIQQGATVDE